MIWNIDPDIIHVGPFVLRYYSLMFVIGFFIMGQYVGKQFKAEGRNPEDVSSLTTHLIIGMLLGSRLAHCFFYDPEYYLAMPWEILKVWEGGLASHGGYLGVIIATLFFIRKHREHEFFHLMDMIAGPSLFVGGLIRIGNLMNSEIYGAPTNLPWAITFVRVDNLPRHPSQIYEAIGYFAIAFLLFQLYKLKSVTWPNGKFFSLAIVLGFSFRFLVEFTKEEQSTALNHSLLNMGQWLSFVFIFLGLVFFLKLRK